MQIGIWFTQLTRFNKPNLPTPLYETYSTEPNFFIGDEAKSTNPNLLIQIYQLYLQIVSTKSNQSSKMSGM